MRQEIAGRRLVDAHHASLESAQGLVDDGIGAVELAGGEWREGGGTQARKRKYHCERQTAGRHESKQTEMLASARKQERRDGWKAEEGRKKKKKSKVHATDRGRKRSR